MILKNTGERTRAFKKAKLPTAATTTTASPHHRYRYHVTSPSLLSSVRTRMFLFRWVSVVRASRLVSEGRSEGVVGAGCWGCEMVREEVGVERVKVKGVVGRRVRQVGG